MNVTRRLGLACAMVLGSAALLFAMTGCQVAGGIADAVEREKIVTVEAEYDGLVGKRVVVLFDTAMDVRYDFPNAVPLLTDYLAMWIAAHCLDSQVLPTRDVMAFQDANPGWPSMDYADIASFLNAERLIIVDLIEYRLMEPGNSYLWNGYIVADVGVIEADGPDPSSFVYQKRMASRFPTVDGVTRDQAPKSTIEDGLQIDFSRKTARLFYTYEIRNEDLMRERGEIR